MNDVIVNFSSPISLEPLYQAVTLYPCMHKLNALEVEGCKGSCPLCHKKIEAFKEDPRIREIVERLFPVKKPESFEGLQDFFLSPIGKEPLKQALTLYPCMDRVNEGEEENPCPVCQQVVQGLGKDHVMRDSAERIFSVEKPDLVLQELILSHFSDQPPQDFPGKSAVFVHVRGDWKERDFGAGIKLRRQLCFRSDTQGSFFQRFSLMGYCDGRICLSVTFSDVDKEKVKNYFASHRLIVSSNSQYCADTTRDMRILFALLEENNRIPDAHLEQVRRIVEKGEVGPSKFSFEKASQWLHI